MRPMSDQTLSPHAVASIISHLGGEGLLARIGVRDFHSDDVHVTFELNHANPKGVRSVVISLAPRGNFSMDCYGRIIPGTFTAPLVGTAREIIPDNLATVLGQLTGIESLHHHHF